MNEIPDRKVLRLTRVCFYSVVSFPFVFRLFQTKNHKNPQWHCLLLHHAEIESCLAACVKMMICKIIKKKVERKESEYSKHTKQHTLTVTEWENQIYTIIKFVFCCWFEQHKKEKKRRRQKTHTHTHRCGTHTVKWNSRSSWKAMACTHTTLSVHDRMEYTAKKNESKNWRTRFTHTFFALIFAFSLVFSQSFILSLSFTQFLRTYEKKLRQKKHNTQHQISVINQVFLLGKPNVGIFIYCIHSSARTTHTCTRTHSHNQRRAHF